MVAGGPTATMSAAAAVWFFVERGRERVEGSRRTGCSPLGGRRRLVTGGDRWRKLGRRRLPEERRLPAEARAAGEEKERAASARAGSGGTSRAARGGRRRAARTPENRAACRRGGGVSVRVLSENEGDRGEEKEVIRGKGLLSRFVAGTGTKDPSVPVPATNRDERVTFSPGW